jgi:hypothetical protein
MHTALTLVLALASTFTSPTTPTDRHPSISDTIRGCAPPKDMGDILAASCIAAGLAEDRCLVIGAACDMGNKCGACDRAVRECDAAGLGSACDQLAGACDDMLKGCGCDQACLATGELTPEQTIALCFLFPSPIGADDCADPSAGQCMAMMGWDDCGIDTCDYIACLEELEELGEVCPAILPKSCEAVAACEAAA